MHCSESACLETGYVFLIESLDFTPNPVLCLTLKCRVNVLTRLLFLSFSDNCFAQGEQFPLDWQQEMMLSAPQSDGSFGLLF